MKIGFDHDQYTKIQSERIIERIDEFGGKLYLELGGKLFDDYHASRVLPGFQPDSKMQMLLKLKDREEILIVLNADDIEKSKVRGDLGLTYDLDTLRLIDAFRGIGLYVGSVVLTRWTGQPAAIAFEQRLNSQGIKTYHHYPIAGYPTDIEHIVSDEGFGRNDYVETSRPLVLVTAPGPGSGKMATCLSQLYQENRRGIKAGYAKFETFPVWNLPLKHPVNVAYEAATADLSDVNMIDPYHLEAYGKTTVNYNRDIEIFPVLNALFEHVWGKSPYKRRQHPSCDRRRPGPRGSHRQPGPGSGTAERRGGNRQNDRPAGALCRCDPECRQEAGRYSQGRPPDSAGGHRTRAGAEV